jgi:hypothetical protein
MTKGQFLFSIILIASVTVYGQSIKIYTSDIDNFWVAYDSVKSTSDQAKQIRYIQQLYLDKATDGLKDFIISRDHTAQRHLKNIIAYPKFWASVRPLTLEIKQHTKEIEDLMIRFKELYPNFKQPNIYFTIGVLNSGGTTGADEILIGSEIACSNKTVDASELSNWLQGVFKDNKDVVYLVAHEVVHTQQKAEGKTLLSNCITEGACDFIAELLLQKPIVSPYMTYGKNNEKELWDAFQKEMNGEDIKNWLYNGSKALNGIADLGYFMGYVICKSYYDNSKNKKEALKEIIELSYDHESVLAFLKKSKYIGGKS